MIGRHKFVDLSGKVKTQVVSTSRRNLNDFAGTMAAKAVEYAPYKHGHLRNSIRPEMVGTLLFRVAAEVNYAAFQEFGTRKIKPRLYMARAFNFARHKFKSANWKLGK